MILYLPPDSPLEQTWEFLTDVITSYDGSEQRLAIRKQPKQRFKATYTYDNFLDMRQARADLYLNTSGDVYFPFWHEGVMLTTDDAIFGTDDAVGDFSKSDLAIGDTVVVVNQDGDAQQMTIDDIDSSSISFSALFDHNFPAGSFVYPAELVYVMNQPGEDLYPIVGARVQLELLSKAQPALVATAGVSYTTYSSKPVLTPRPIMEGNTTKVAFDRRFEQWETENDVFQDTATPYSAVISAKSYVIKTQQQRQDWKKFFLDIAGGREAFWVPSWQADLEITAQPSSTTIKVSADLDYKTTYYDTNAIKNLMLVYNDGTVAYRSVTNCVVNMDGTQTLTLNSSYTNGSVKSVSFLELSRLAQNEVSWAHYAGYSMLKFTVQTVRG